MRKKTVIKHKFKTYFISFIALFLLIASFFLIYSSLNVKTSSSIALLTYSEKSNLDYKVYLKKNNYFKEKYLPKNRQYIASVIDYIDIFFDYSFASSKPIEAKYKYKIVAKIGAQYKVDTNSSKQVWENEYVLLEDQELEIKEKSSFSIKENVKIEYDKYNQIINNFKKDYMLSVTADLKVSLLIEVDGKYVPADKVFDIDADINLNIPLSEQTINITMDYKNINNSQILSTQKLSRFSNIPFFILGLITSVVSTITIGIVIKRILLEDKKQTKYIKTLKKILHDYGDIIVEVKSPPELPKDKSSEVMNFSELVNAQLEVRSPIIFSERATNEISQFILFDKEYAYYYLLKSEELDKNMK